MKPNRGRAIRVQSILLYNDIRQERERPIIKLLSGAVIQLMNEKPIFRFVPSQKWPQRPFGEIYKLKIRIIHNSYLCFMFQFYSALEIFQWILNRNAFDHLNSVYGDSVKSMKTLLKMPGNIVKNCGKYVILPLFVSFSLSKCYRNNIIFIIW